MIHTDSRKRLLRFFVRYISIVGSNNVRHGRPKMALPELPPVSSVSPRVLRVLGCNPSMMTLQGTNTYVVGTGPRRILIDTGEPKVPEYIKNLKETMDKYKFDLEHIIISHWHRDHIGGVSDVMDAIDNKTDCKVWKFHPENEKKRTYKFPINCPINSLKNYQVFNTEGATLKVYHSPGHTTDHVMLTLEEDNALFSADCVLGEGTTVFENLEDYLKSLQLILELNPGVMYPGHGSVINDTVQRVNDYIQHRIARDREIIKILTEHPLQAMTVKDFVDVIYKGISKKLLEVAAISVVQHLLKLKKEGKVLEIDGHWKINKKSNL